MSLQKLCSLQTQMQKPASLECVLGEGSDMLVKSDSSSHHHTGRGSSFYILISPPCLFPSFKGCFHFCHVFPQEMWGMRRYPANTLCCTREALVGLG